MDRGVERVSRELAGGVDVVQEGGRVGRLLEDVVQVLGARAHPEHVADLAEAAPREAIASREPDLLRVDAAAELANASAIRRIAVVVPAVSVEHPLVGGAVDVVDGAADRRQAAGEERLAQAVGSEREVGEHAEPAEALPQDAPAVDAELAADPLRVAHDRVGAEVAQVVRLLLGRLPGQAADRRRAARPALVEHEDAELGQRAVEPEGRGRDPGRARRLEPRPSLEEDQERPVEPVGVRHLAREDGDPLAVGPAVVERHRELVLGEHEAGGCGRFQASVAIIPVRRRW